MHQRQIIREAVKNALLNQTDAQARVYESRMAPHKKLGLPAIVVYTLSESVADNSKTTAPRILERRLQLAIEVAVKATDNLDDVLDGLAEQIERAMHRDPTFANKASDVILASTEMELFEEQSERIGAMKLVYDVTYFTNAPDAADVTLDAFVTGDIKHNLNNAQEAANRANDRITLPQV